MHKYCYTTLSLRVLQESLADVQNQTTSSSPSHRPNLKGPLTPLILVLYTSDHSQPAPIKTGVAESFGSSISRLGTIGWCNIAPAKTSS